MKKGKVEWLYKVAALMPDGKVGIDFLTDVEKWSQKEVQKLAEALKTNVHVEYMGTIINPPKSDKNTMTYDFLTEEEKETRLAFARKQYEKEAAALADTNEDSVQ